MYSKISVLPLNLPIMEIVNSKIILSTGGWWDVSFNVACYVWDVCAGNCDFSLSGSYDLKSLALCGLISFMASTMASLINFPISLFICNLSNFDSASCCTGIYDTNSGTCLGINMLQPEE